MSSKPTKPTKGKKKGGKSKGGQGKIKGKKGDSGPGFPINAKVAALWRDGTKRNAIVLEKGGLAANDPALVQYYVHFEDFNRRMDEWLPADRVFAREQATDLVTTQEVEDGKGVIARKRKKGDEEVYEFVEAEHGEHDGMDEESIRMHEETTKVKNVKRMEIGRYQIETWYFSPLPKEYWKDGPIEMLYFCEFSLKFFLTKEELVRYQRTKLKFRGPPGNEIYRHDGVAMFEVDGAIHTEYCQNLSYIAKMFLDHKTLEYDVDIFFFYVLCELDEYGYHIVGYFSKDKHSAVGYNLACILTLPCFQKRGYGRFLIQFSYELSKIERKMGSPEKPLSDLGLLSYRSYWAWQLLKILKDYAGGSISINDLVRLTSINVDDIQSTFQTLGIVKYWNGQHILCVSKELLEEKFKKLDSKPGPQVDPEYIHWVPAGSDRSRRDKWTIKDDDEA